MKKELLYLLLSQKNKIDKSVMKKIIIAASLFGVVLIIGIVLTVYAGIKASSYLISQVSNKEQVAQIGTDITNKSQQVLSTVQSNNCYIEIRKHLDLNVWLTSSVADNANKLLNACWFTPASNLDNQEKPWS